MATITVGGSGNWDSTTPNAPWPGGTLPTIADAVVINNAAHVLTLKGTAMEAYSIALTNGRLAVDQTADTTITTQVGITGANSATSFFDWDVSGSAYTHRFFTNKADVASPNGSNGIQINNSRATLLGVTRTRWTQTDAALTTSPGTSAHVEDATGWQVGDQIVFGTTQAYNATPKTDKVTLTSVTFDSGTTGPATIGWSGAVTNSHDSGCYVGNFTSNLIVGPYTAGKGFNLVVQSNGNSVAQSIDHVMFKSAFGGFGTGCLVQMQVGSSAHPPISSISNNAFWDCVSGIGGQQSRKGATVRQNNIFYTERTDSYPMVGGGQTSYGDLGDETDCVIFRARAGISLGHPGLRFVRPRISGCYGYAVNPAMFDGLIEDGDIWANATVLNVAGSVSVGTTRVVRAGLGTAFSGAVNGRIAINGAAYGISFEDCPLDTTGAVLLDTLVGMPAASYANFLNKNQDVTAQELYKPNGNFIRSNSEINRSTSSLSIKPLVAGYDNAYEVSIPCANGATVRVIGYVKADTNFYNGGGAGWTAPTVALSGTIAGVTLTPDTFTASSAANNAFEQCDISITNTSGADGNVTLTFTANAKSVVTGTVYFDGMPTASPFVTKARHYGFTFDQIVPNASVNSSVSASEATALGYSTKFSVTGGASQSDVALTASATFQQLYDYTQAWACTTANLAYAIPCTSPAGSGNLIAAGDVTATGYTLNGSGSLAMGSNTLTANDAFSYTYTGGTFSQASTVPSFSGGTLNIGAAGTYTYAQAAAMILSMTPTAPGTYALGDTTFTGQVDLRNTSGSHAITVELPTGTSYTTANNSGATITVTVPIVTADISITGMVNTTGANNRLQIINQSAIAAPDWQSTHVYAAGDLVLRTSGIGNESTAGLYMRCTSGGTSNGSEPTWDTTVGNTTTDGTVTWTTYSVLYYDADPASTSLTDTYIDGEEFLAGETIEIRFAEEDPGVSFKTYSTSVVATTDGFSALVNEESDDVYAIYALSGATYETTFSPNYVANYIVLDANTDFSGKAAYAYYCYLLTTSQGMYLFWGGLTGIDPGNIRNNVDTISLYFDESGGFVKQTDDVRIFRSDSTRPAIDPTTGGSGIEINWRTPVSVVSTGGSALTSEEHNALLALPTATDVWNNSKALTVPKFLGLK